MGKDKNEEGKGFERDLNRESGRNNETARPGRFINHEDKSTPVIDTIPPPKPPENSD